MKAVNIPEYLNRFLYGFTEIRLNFLGVESLKNIFTEAVPARQEVSIRIQNNCPYTMESYPYQINLDRKWFRYSGVDTAMESLPNGPSL